MPTDTVTVSPKYQVVIPRAFRERHHIKPGNKLTWVEFGGVVHLEPSQPASAYRGIARGINTTVPDEPERF